MSQQPISDPGLEAWAGIECSVNRVGDRWFDQLERSGHAARDGDLELFAGLGVKAMRYPVLWERVAAQPEDTRWEWSDRRLERLRELGIRPIVGLLHHGSGPPGTSLVDPDFPARLADHAAACARRYPWVADWTPINEPLTTARFSGLYGLWYPHGTDQRCFATALLTQCRAIAASMVAIRAEVPAARLVQTEDLGKIWSTPELAYQAAWENTRRWLSLDLLCGRVRPGHRAWSYLLHAGLEPAALEHLAAHPCPPAIIGINHYITSERYLDHRLERFPPATHGGNGRDRYADVEAVRACALAGPEALLREAWDRYRLPLAVTETHLQCSRDEQLRWFAEMWATAQRLRAGGVDLRAVTAWAGLGAFDWNSLLTRSAGYYEPGLFDVRAPRPRPTALARLVEGFAKGRPLQHPVLQAPGWWRRSVRLTYDIGRDIPVEPVPQGVAPLLVTGKSGLLGAACLRACALRGLTTVATARDELDIADPAAVRAALERHRPWAVVNAAGFAQVRGAQFHGARCWRENHDGPVVLARACAELGIPAVFMSSHQVFAGDSAAAYRESDRPAPRNVYGHSKARAEEAIGLSAPRALIVRSAAFFSADDERSFLGRAMRAIAHGRPFEAYHDVAMTPTHLPDLVHAMLDLLIDGEVGIWHLANSGPITWYDFARRGAELAGLDRDLLVPVPAPDFIPRATALTSERGGLMGPLDEALERWRCAQARPAGDAQPAHDATDQLLGADLAPSSA